MKLIPKMLLGLGLMALPALCSPIVMNQWYTFGWSGAPTTPGLGGSPFGPYTGTLGTVIAGTTCSPGPAPCTDPWTFTGAANLVLQDLFYDGDQFQVFDFGSSIGTTSVPANDGTLCGASPANDPAGCSGNAKFSSGTFALGSGSHSITISVIAETPNTTSGAAVFELTSVTQPSVPEPTTLSMMGLGLGGLFLGWRARRKV